MNKDTKNTFQEFAKVLEVCIDKLIHNNNEKFKAFGNTIERLHDKITILEETISKTKKVDDTKEKTYKIIKTKVEQENTTVVSPSPTSVPVVTVSSSITSSQKPHKSKYLSKPKVLFVGDSVAHTANLRKLEKSRKCRIRSLRAYSSVYDDLARFPEQNFKEVVSYNLDNPGRENYDVLIVSCPTVDISNTDPTRMNMNKIEEKVFQSSKNMMNIAEEAIAKHRSLKQVIIMEHPPRFDGMKSQLVQVANNALKDLHANSPCKDMIFIGQHSLESHGVGDMHLARYQDSFTGRYDGVHLYGAAGARDYTDSVDSLLLMAFSGTRTEQGSTDDHTNCEQAQYQWRQARIQRRQTVQRYDQHINKVKGPRFIPSVSTQNRFTIFNQGN